MDRPATLEPSRGANALVRALESADITFERLYRIEIQRALDAPAAYAPQSRFARVSMTRGRRPEQGPAEPDWKTVAMLYDLHDRRMPEIVAEVSELLRGAAGRHRLQIFYWSGIMRAPTATRIMGSGESFLYSPNPRGDLVLRLEPPIELDLGEEE